MQVSGSYTWLNFKCQLELIDDGSIKIQMELNHARIYDWHRLKRVSRRFMCVFHEY